MLITFFQIKCDVPTLNHMPPTTCDLFFQPYHFVIVCLHLLIDIGFKKSELIIEIVQKTILFCNHFTQLQSLCLVVILPST
jgi:hypothetical protein